MKRKKEFYESTKEDVVEYDSSLQAYIGWGVWIEPMSLYRTARVISFAFEIYESAVIGSTGFSYSVTNFDRKKENKFV